MIAMMVVHGYSILICLSRELFDVRIGTFGSIMKMLEVIGVYLYLAVLIICLSQFSFWFYELTDASLKLYEPTEDKSAMNIILSHKPKCL